MRHSSSLIAPVRAALCLICFGAFGCIDEARERPADTTTADVTLEVEPDVAPDSADDTGTDTGVIEVTPECTRDEQCVERGGDACNSWRCLEQRCELTRAEVGTLCDNGSGKNVGACVQGGYVPADKCDAAGICQDATPALDPSNPSLALAGDWFVVFTTFGGSGLPTTARAVLDVAPGDNSFTTRAARAYGGLSPFVDGQQGIFCTDEAGTIEGRLQTGEMVGHQLDEHLAVMADPTSDGVSVSLRADEGSSTQVDGRYAYLQTTIVFDGTTPTTWRGFVDFNGGCITAGSVLTDPSRVESAYDFVGSGTDCLTASEVAGETSLFQLLTHSRARTGSDTASYPIDLRGAIGRGGDVLLMVKDQDSGSGPTTTPEYGMVLMVRDEGDSAPLPPATFVGQWAYTFQAKLAGDAVRRDYGHIEWGADSTISGGLLETLVGEKPVSEGWYLLNAPQRRLSQKITVAGLSLYQYGFVDPSRRFIIGWNVNPPADDRIGIELGDVPRFGSILLMLRTGP